MIAHPLIEKYYNSLEPDSKKAVGWFLLIVSMFLAFAVLNHMNWRPEISKEEKMLTRTQPIVSTTAEAFYDEFYKDYKKATDKYLTKVVEITGTVRLMGTNTAGALYVNLKGSEDAADVQCTFLERFQKTAAALKIGDTVKIKGTFTAYIIYPVVDRCIIKKDN